MVRTSGEGSAIVKVRKRETPPPGAGLNTVTSTVPPAATSLAGIAALNWVVLTTVVVRFEPFQRTTELEIKFLPVAVSVKAAPPAVALAGEIEVSVGTGFEGGGGADEVPPPPQPIRKRARIKIMMALTRGLAGPPKERRRGSVLFGGQNMS